MASPSITIARCIFSVIVAPRCLGLSAPCCCSLLIASLFPLAPCIRCCCFASHWIIHICLLRTNFPVAFYPDKVRNLRHLRSHWIPTCRCTQGAWSRADWAVDCRVFTLSVSLDSNLGDDDRRLREDLVEILAMYVDDDCHCQRKQMGWRC